MTVVTFQNGVDGYAGCVDSHINANAPNVNYGAAQTFGLGRDGLNINRYFHKSDLTSLPSNAVVIAASLDIYLANNWYSRGDTFNAYRVKRAWTGAAVTWGDYDHPSLAWSTAGCGDTTSDRESGEIGSLTITTSTQGTFITIPLDASLVQEWISGDFDNNGLIVQLSAETNQHYHDFRSADYADADYRPKFTVTYALFEVAPVSGSGTIALTGSADLNAGMDADGGISLAGSASLSAIGFTLLDVDGTIGLRGGYADLDQWEPMAAVGTVSLDGAAWLTAVIHGDDTLAAFGTIALRGTAVRLSTGESLPPTDDDGWTAPDVTTPDLRGLVVKVAGISIKRAQITDLVIDLDIEGGPKSATLSVNSSLTRAPRIARDTLLVTYKSHTLFRGRLENIASNIDSSTGYTLTYAGPLVTLRDHKGYRTVFVDSDLADWQTDQGPRTSPDTFNGVTVGGA